MAKKYRIKKQINKNSNQMTGIHVNFPYAKENLGIHTGRMMPNGFVVYTEKYVSYLKSEMERNNIQNNNILYVDYTGFVYDSDIQNLNRTPINQQKQEECFEEEWMLI